MKVVVGRSGCVLKRGALLFIMIGLATGTAGCMDQYNPRPFWAQYKQERELANRKMPKLTEKGEMPTAGGATNLAASSDPAVAKFAQFCSTCHGDDGQGNGAGAAGLTPKPRNFHDKAWQGKVDDAHIAGVIKEGGAKFGLSAVMPPWGAVLNQAELDGIVQMIRAWGK